MLFTRNTLNVKDMYIKSKKMEKRSHINSKHKKESQNSYITSDKIDLRVKNTTEIEEYFLVIKGSNQQDLIILGSYVSNNEASIYMKQNLKELKVGVDKPTITVGNFLAHLLFYGTKAANH